MRLFSTVKSYSGFAVAIAWPETYCKQAGSWYDWLLKAFGFGINHYYKVGHAAVVLIDSKNGKCHYFDFGRYHAPFGYGRVRSEETDHELKIETNADITNKGMISNFYNLLVELQKNYACHGAGPVYASYCSIDFDKAFLKARQMQIKNPWKYGPFIWSGTNCSRFVRTVILAGNPELQYKLKMAIPLTISPSPMGNVNALFQKLNVNYPMQNISPPVNNVILNATLPAPEKKGLVTEDAQWLAGEGAGSWFSLLKKDNHFEVSRYNSEGFIECRGIYETFNNELLDLDQPFKIVHLSDCSKVSIIQKENFFILTRVQKKKEQDRLD